MDSKTLRLLLVEDDLEEEHLLCEALAEIEEHGQWFTWRTSNVVHVEQLADALDCLHRDSYDAILLNLSLPDSPALLDSFLETHASACGAPILVLADEEDEDLANRLLREGAQDVLLKSELDYRPLARSVRYAVERQRRNSGSREITWMDKLTGTLTCEAFLGMARHDAQLAGDNGVHLLVSCAEVPERAEKTPESRDARDLLLIRVADALRSRFLPPALIGRLDGHRFGILTAGLREQNVHACLEHVRESIAMPLHWAVQPLLPETSLDELLAPEHMRSNREFRAREFASGLH